MVRVTPRRAHRLRIERVMLLLWLLWLHHAELGGGWMLRLQLLLLLSLSVIDGLLGLKLEAVANLHCGSILAVALLLWLQSWCRCATVELDWRDFTAATSAALVLLLAIVF